MGIKQWPVSERPREKLLRNGGKELTDGELLALLLGSGARGVDVIELARSLLERCGGLSGLVGLSPAALAKFNGLGPARIARVHAAIELGRRYLSAPLADRRALKTPHDAVQVFKARLADLPHEIFSCLFLDTRHRMIAYEELFRGTVDGAMVYPREVLKRALHHNAAAMIVAHNHPSGVSEPSEADRGITLKLSKALAMIDVRLLDHFIVSRGGHVSLAELGWM